MKGYFEDPEATAEVLRGGWMHTGDAAVVHPDSYIEVRDRLKDVIISGGENISSVEVEGALLKHTAVQEVAVVGTPHEKWGEAPHAFVVLKAGAAATEEELREFARANMAHFKVPSAFTILTELPKTATGKFRSMCSAVARRQLRSSETRAFVHRHVLLLRNVRSPIVFLRATRYSLDHRPGGGGLSPWRRFCRCYRLRAHC